MIKCFLQVSQYFPIILYYRCSSPLHSTNCNFICRLFLHVHFLTNNQSKMELSLLGVFCSSFFFPRLLLLLLVLLIFHFAYCCSIAGGDYILKTYVWLRKRKENFQIGLTRNQWSKLAYPKEKFGYLDNWDLRIWWIICQHMHVSPS